MTSGSNFISSQNYFWRLFTHNILDFFTVTHSFDDKEQQCAEESVIEDSCCLLRAILLEINVMLNLYQCTKLKLQNIQSCVHPASPIQKKQIHWVQHHHVKLLHTQIFSRSYKDQSPNYSSLEHRIVISEARLELCALGIEDNIFEDNITLN